MINGLDILSYKSQRGDGLNLTGTNLKGKGCDTKCNKKKNVKKQHGRGLTILK